MLLSKNDIIRMYRLQNHPEGGYFRETYRSTESIAKESLPQRFAGERQLSTAIYFLLPEGTKSCLHRIHSDEIWHFYLGGSMTIVQISPEGVIEKTTLGQNIQAGQKLQHMVPHGFWFGAYPNLGTEFSFVGCTVAPGFDFSDFEMGDRKDLLKKFPKAKEEILLLTN